ncbi:MAG: galactose-1-phosphate uridylyltransferase [Acidimicrobiia bacterium]|nr:galactose-1-phosphate uridylyltransferase [Acidimicrobiia bacterium]
MATEDAAPPHRADHGGHPDLDATDGPAAAAPATGEPAMADPPFRRDPLTGDVTFVVPKRQGRPNLPDSGCPFCVGGLEAPEPYDVRWFTNRWPALPDGRAEVVLYTSDHDATFASLGTTGARKVVDLWAERSAELGARDDVRYVLVFENRGPEVGATIAHPHGQIYAYDVVPPRPLDELRRADPSAFDDQAAGPDEERLVARRDGWRAWVPRAATWPYELLLAPSDAVPDLPSLDDDARTALAALLVDVLARLDGLFDRPMPYMMWFHQRPFDGGHWPEARVHLHIVPIWRSAGVARYVAAAELGGAVYFNPIDPVDAAAALRAVDPTAGALAP